MAAMNFCAYLLLLSENFFYGELNGSLMTLTTLHESRSVFIESTQHKSDKPIPLIYPSIRLKNWKEEICVENFNASPWIGWWAIGLSLSGIATKASSSIVIASVLHNSPWCPIRLSDGTFGSECLFTVNDSREFTLKIPSGLIQIFLYFFSVSLWIENY